MNIGAMVKRLIEAGADPAVAAEVVAEAFQAGVAAAPIREVEVVRETESVRQARNRRYYQANAERLASERRLKATESQTIKTLSVARGSPSAPPDGFPPVYNPPSLTPSPPSPQRLPAREAAFEVFWREYPHKVGKGDARKSFERALKTVDFLDLMAGLRRYAAKRDDRPWCNPATWLNQQRWTDEPAEQPDRNAPRPNSKDESYEIQRRILRSFDPIPDIGRNAPGGGEGDREEAFGLLRLPKAG